MRALFLLLSLLIAVPSCAPKEMKLYKGPDLGPADEVTLSSTEGTLIVRVDGRKTQGVKKIRIDPGIHDIDLKFVVSTASREYRNSERIRFSPTFKAGHNYVAAMVGIDDRIVGGFFPGPTTLDAVARSAMDPGDQHVDSPVRFRSPTMGYGSATVVGVAYAREAPALYHLGDVLLLQRNDATKRWVDFATQGSSRFRPLPYNSPFPWTRRRVIDLAPADIKPHMVLVDTNSRGGFTIRNVPAGNYYLLALFDIGYPTVENCGVATEISLRDGENSTGNRMYLNFGPTE